MKKQVFNPFLPLDTYIPDGEPHIFGDRVYLYGSHDFEGGRTFCMGDYTVYSASVDELSDWRCDGVIYRAEQDPDYSSRPYMYAPDVVQGNDGVAAAVATILLVVTTVSLLLFMKFSKNKELAI